MASNQGWKPVYYRPRVKRDHPRTLNHNNSQCWKLAHEAVEHLPRISESHLTTLADMLEYEFISGRSYVVELEISDALYPHPKESFYLPRLFCHSFNVIIDDESVDIRQSWFKTMRYQTIYSFTHAEFEGFWENTVIAMKTFLEQPMYLFSMYGHRGGRPIHRPLDHIKSMNHSELTYRIDIYEHGFSGEDEVSDATSDVPSNAED